MITIETPVSLEAFIDVLAEVFIGPEFAAALQRAHAEARRKIPLRTVEAVYTEEIETPDGYPCLELIALSEDDDPESQQASNVLHEISAQWTVNGDNEQVMGRELKRLVLATRDCLRNVRMQPQIGGGHWTGRVDYSPIVEARRTDGSARYIKSASVAIMWRAFER